MLETTLSTIFTPGTNLKGKVTGANWIFLLPSLELERIICVGEVSATTLAMLARMGDEVVVVCPDVEVLDSVKEICKQDELVNVQVFMANGRLPLSDNSTDLLLIVHPRNASRVNRGQVMLAEVKRLLKPEGLVYFEFDGHWSRLLRGDLAEGLSATLGQPQLFWLTPLRGEMHTAVPLTDKTTIHYFLRRHLFSPTITLTAIKQAGRLVKRRRKSSVETTSNTEEKRKKPATSSGKWIRSLAIKSGFGLLNVCRWAEGLLLKNSRIAWRYGALLGRPATAADTSPPHYLRKIARQGGVNIDQYRWGLSAQGQYSSRKLLFFLFNGDASLSDTSPTYIVKMVRDKEFNARLENEYRALLLLREKGIGDYQRLPQVVFWGHHSELAIVGETMIEGVPFRQRTRFTADCPYGRSAVAWLVELGMATATTTDVAPVQAANNLMYLFERLAEIYTLTPVEHAFLVEQISMIGQSLAPFPVVFQHGDPGTWNVIATPAGHAAFLDWEAAEPQGMPLWDIFYFMRSYAIGAARQDGTHNRLEGFRQQLLEDSALARFLHETTDIYCEKTALSRHLIAPLFYTCWLHRALKEATRLPVTKLDDGHYINLLRLCIKQRYLPAID